MATDPKLDALISTWLDEEAPAGLPDRVLRSTFERTRRSRQKGGWRAWRPARALGRQAWGPRFAGVSLLLVVALLLIALIATLALGATWWLKSIVTVSPSTSPPSSSETALPGPTSTALVGPSRVVAYKQNGRIWVVNVDGTSGRQLVPLELDPEKPRYLDGPDRQFPIAWSPDGTRLYYWFARTESRGPNDGVGERHGGVAVTDLVGSAPIDLVDVAEHAPDGGLCPTPIQADNCQANIDGLALSPDGTRFAYDILEGRDLNISTVVVLDIRSGEMRRLESTRTKNRGSLPNGGIEPCSEVHQGYNTDVRWSPDGTRLLFTRVDCGGGLFTIEADGTDLRQIVSEAAFFQVIDPAWSPDGSSIVFHANTDLPAGDETKVAIYTVRPDGTGLRALTTDGNSLFPFWTRDGRVVFIRWAGEGLGHLWLMDADGGHHILLDATVPALTAAGCVVCPFPVGPVRDPGQPNQLIGEFEDPGGSTGSGLDIRLWQPVPADQR
jgi:Tol biopolymer transport system component